MNVLFLSIDSLNRHYLNAYEPSADIDVATPNFDAFAEKAATFDTHYAGSLPCMPARREWFTGTQEFLWRPWGPMEPFDTPLAEAARTSGTLTQLITDHFHYFQHGSNGYFEDYNGFEFIRGHEYDRWKTSPRNPDPDFLSQITETAPQESDDINLDAATASDEPDDMRYMNRTVYARNVADFEDESDFFAPKTFSKTADWLSDNRDWDDWFLYVDSFDVHEPFHIPEPYASMYTDEDPTDPDLSIWPYYGRIDEGQSELSERELDFVKAQFAGEVTMVDEWFGTVLDRLDEEDLWDETAVILTSDHGFFLGDHGYVGKPFEAPMYNVLAQTPLFIWHPESPRMGERITELTSAVDLYATITEILETGIDDTRHSQSLLPLLMDQTSEHRDWALYGFWGSSVNITDGEYTYHHPCDSSIPVECYSTSMMDTTGWFTPPQPKHDAEAGQFLPYTNSPVWKFEGPAHSRHDQSMLFDIQSDPWQETNLTEQEPAHAEEMRSLLINVLQELEAPDSQFERLGLEA